MTDSNGPQALEQTLATAVSLADALLQSRKRDEQELIEQVAKISAAKAAAAQKAKDRLTARLEERQKERESTEQIQAALQQVSELGAGLSKQTVEEAEAAKAQVQSLQSERDALQAALDDEKSAIEKEREAILNEKESWDQQRQALEQERETLTAAVAEREKDLEESAGEAARAMSELRAEIEQQSGANLDAAKAENDDLTRRVDDLQLLVKVKTEMMEKFEKVIGDRDTSIQSLIADVEEKGESLAHLSENLNALRADYAAKEKAAATHEAKSTASATVIETLKNQLSKVSEEKQKLEAVLIARSKTIDELQSLVKVLSGDTDVEFADADDDPVSLPGGAPIDDGGDGAMPAPVDVGSLPDAAPIQDGLDPDDDGEPDVLIEEDLPKQTGEIAKAAALAAAAAQSARVSDETVAAALAEATSTEADVPDADVGGWAAAVDGDAPAPTPAVEDSVEESFFGIDVAEVVEQASAESPSASPGDDIDLSDIDIEEDVRPLNDDDVVQKTDALDAYDCQGAEEVKLAGILSHQPWRVEEITKLTKLDGAFVREKLASFAKSGLIEIVTK